MTVETEVDHFPFTGDGVTTVFGFTSRLLSLADLSVAVDGTEVITGFSVLLVDGGSLGANVTFSVAPAAGVGVVLLRKPAITQPLDFSLAGLTLESALELGLDRVVMSQQYLARLFTRSLRLADTDPDAGGLPVIPGPAARANTTIGFDDEGQLTLMLNTPSGTVELATEADAIAGVNGTKVITPLTAKAAIDARASGSAESRTVLKALGVAAGKAVYLAEAGREGAFVWTTGDFSAQVALDTREGIYIKATAVAATAGAWVRAERAVLRPEWFGAVGNGSTNDGPAINAALAIGGIGAIVEFQSKIYATTETISVHRDGQKLIGRQAGATFSVAPTTTQGTVLRWHGASGGTLCYFGCDPAGTADMSGGGIESIQFNGQAIADRVLHIRSCTFSTFRHVKAVSPRNNSAAWTMVLDSDVQARPGINSVFRCNFYNTAINTNGGSGGGLLITGAIDESAARHTAFTSFHGLHVGHDDGDAIKITSADDMFFSDIAVSKTAGGTGRSVHLIPAATRSVVGLTFIQVHLGSNDTPEFRADGSAASSNVHGIAIYGLQGVDEAPTITEVGNATIEVVDYLGESYDPDASVRAALRKGPPTKVGNFASADDAALDYYKERTGVLGLSFGGAATGITYSVNFYRSTRVGNVVHFKAHVTLTSKGSATGSMLISALPYAAIDGYSLNVYATNMTSGVGDTMLMALANTGTGITVYKMVAGVATALTHADFTNTSSLILSGSCHTTDAAA